MTDTTQLLLIAAITVMTLLLTVIGIQLIFVLREARSLLSKINAITTEFEKIGFDIGRGYSEIMGFASGFKKLWFVVDLLSKRKKQKKNGNS